HYGRISHFLCVNLNGEIELIETQKGHPEVAKIYVVVVLPQDQAGLPVTISFQDINADGKLDALVHYGSTEIPLYNNCTTFQSQPQAAKKKEARMHERVQTDERESPSPQTEPLDPSSTVESTLAESVVTGTEEPEAPPLSDDPTVPLAPPQRYFQVNW